KAVNAAAGNAMKLSVLKLATGPNAYVIGHARIAAPGIEVIHARLIPTGHHTARERNGSRWLVIACGNHPRHQIITEGSRPLLVLTMRPVKSPSSPRPTMTYAAAR